MQVINDTALVLRTRKPHLLDEKSATYKIIKEEDDGMYTVAVKWTLEDAQILAGLGVKDVPSPIQRDYKWTGKFKPFDHQKETSGFLTLHKKAL